MLDACAVPPRRHIAFLVATIRWPTALAFLALAAAIDVVELGWRDAAPGLAVEVPVPHMAETARRTPPFRAAHGYRRSARRRSCAASSSVEPIRPRPRTSARSWKRACGTCSQAAGRKRRIGADARASTPIESNLVWCRVAWLPRCAWRQAVVIRMNERTRSSLAPRLGRAPGHQAAGGTASRIARTASRASSPWRCSRGPPRRSRAGSA